MLQNTVGFQGPQVAPRLTAVMHPLGLAYARIDSQNDIVGQFMANHLYRIMANKG